MSDKKDKKDRTRARANHQTLPCEPVDVVDGIADRFAQTPPWKYAVLAVIFALWIAVLLYCQRAGNLPQ